MITYTVTISTAPTDSQAGKLAIIMMLSSLFLIKTLSVRVYKKWPLDALESVLIINTICMAAVALYVDRTDNIAIGIAATSTSTTVVGILLICVLLYHIKKNFIKRNFDIKNLSSKSKKNTSHDDPELAVHYVTSFSATNPGALDQLPSAIQHPLAINRHASILAVMGTPKESDYQ